MTEAEWRTSQDPETMLSLVQGRLSERKLRLIACAAARAIWHLLNDDASRCAVEVAELYAEGRANEKDRAAARTAAVPSANRRTGPAAWTAYWVASRNAAESTSAALVSAAEAVGQEARRRARDTHGDQAAAVDAAFAAAAHDQAELLREIIGNPYRVSQIDPVWLAWRRGAVELAHAIDEEQRWQDMPVLADALEEAGCADADILDHCRGQRPHRHGCWVVDLLLEKE